MRRRAKGNAPQCVGFLLLPDFAMMAFASAIEPLRAANRLSGRELYEWRLISTRGEPVAASNGIAVMPHAGLAPDPRLDAVIVCAGLDAHRFSDDRVFGWLRHQARHGSDMGAISTGSLILARSGLLDGYRCTIHWENLSSIAEEFPDIEITQNVFELDGDRFTCSGGTAALDMMLNIIAIDHGGELTARVSDQFIHERIRTPGDHQRGAEQARLGIKSPKLLAAIVRMEDNLEAPLPLTEIASGIRLSPRQLERLFRRHLGCTPKRYYRDLRLRRARLLLRQTGQSIVDVLLGCGFASHSHFTRCYRERFGCTPKQERAASL